MCVCIHADRCVCVCVCVFRLTEKERRDLNYKRNVLKLAKEHKAAKEIERVDRYYLPKDDVKPQEKYVEDATERGPNYEQRRWEDEHFNAGTLRFGARDAREKSKKSKTYDVIMDEEIEFVQALKMPGTLKEKEEKYKVGGFCPLWLVFVSFVFVFIDSVLGLLTIFLYL